MATRAQIDVMSKRSDARDLEAAARIVRRRLKQQRPAGVALAAFCRVLTELAEELRAEAAVVESSATGGGVDDG